MDSLIVLIWTCRIPFEMNFFLKHHEFLRRLRFRGDISNICFREDFRFFLFSHSTSNAHISVIIGPLSLKMAPEIENDLLFLDFDLDHFEQRNARYRRFCGICGNQFYLNSLIDTDNFIVVCVRQR
jgi:hypothetical protein